MSLKHVRILGIFGGATLLSFLFIYILSGSADATHLGSPKVGASHREPPSKVFNKSPVTTGMQVVYKANVTTAGHPIDFSQYQIRIDEDANSGNGFEVSIPCSANPCVSSPRGPYPGLVGKAIRFYSTVRDDQGSFAMSKIISFDIANPVFSGSPPEPLDFGSVIIGNSVDKDPCFSGNVIIDLEPTTSGTDAGDFSSTTWSLVMNPPGVFDLRTVAQACPEYTFSPSSPAGTKNATIDFSTSDGPFTYDLKGTALAAAGKADFMGRYGTLSGTECGASCTITAGDTLCFEDRSDPGYDNWFYDFYGGASNANGPTPPADHCTVYNTTGTYDVTLSVGGGYADSEDKAAYVFVGAAALPKPTANFQMFEDATNNSAPPATIDVGEAVRFEDASSPSVGETLTGWSWTFDSGSSLPSASIKGPHIVTYNTAGTKSICLTVTQSNGTNDTRCKTLAVAAGSVFSINATPVPFSGTPTLDVDFNLQVFNEAGSDIKFDAACNGVAPISNTIILSGPWPGPVLWTLPGGVCSYGTSGTKTGTIFAEDQTSFDTASAPFTVTVTNAPVADFTFSVNNFVVDFQGSASGGCGGFTNWCWDFGDGTPLQCGITSNPSHDFGPASGGSPATYPVTLTVEDSCNITSAPVTKSVSVGPPIQIFNISFPNPLTATDTSTLIDGIITWLAWIIIPLAILIIIYAAFRYLIGGSLPEERQKAIKIIQYALVGIVVVLFARIIKNVIEFLLS